ncbi:LysR substrate-binding domain-containing protein [Photobacterium sp. TY1-4]|uniref:LysR substrate-binding domain-containing protein n=1 Tax=Photobacterium sp. TY1-4 TaxID=2899122 RepID=UPI0021C193DA|nr:LysR substrate-binding domain-containing protein [Photobacterium sp. TY1-4]UXI04555.1 LysR substrate-binding domain-containing protein [Photobacterium sp. TY1-4]
MTYKNLPATRALRTFEAAGRHLNFTKAADEVGLTPAAVSYQIKEIETQLALKLFHRTSRTIALTPAGEIMLRSVTASLDGLQRALGQARQASRTTDQLRISLGARFATNWLFPRLGALKAVHPELELAFDITDEIRDFERDDIDVAIRFGDGQYPGTHALKLFETEVVPVCSPEWLNHHPDLCAPEDLQRYTLSYVDCTTQGKPWPNWSMWMAAAGVDDFDDSRAVGFSDLSHVVQAAIEGSVVGLAEPVMIERELAQGRLVRLFEEVHLRVAPHLAYHVVCPDDLDESSAAARFRDWLVYQALCEVHLSSPAEIKG